MQVNLYYKCSGYAGADPYLLNRMLIIKGWITVFLTDAKIQISPRQTNYSLYYKKISAGARVNYSLTTTLLWY